jgi:hypothetical protein
MSPPGLYRPDPTAKPAQSAGPLQNPPPGVSGPSESGSQGPRANVYAPSPDTPERVNPPQPPPNDPTSSRNSSAVSRPTSHVRESTHQGSAQESSKKISSYSTGESPVHPGARGVSSGPELSAHQVETLVRGLLAETHLITRSLENPSGLLRFASTAVSSSLMSQAATASRGATGSLDRSFHGIFQMLGPNGRSGQPSLPPNLKTTSSPLVPQESASPQGKALVASVLQDLSGVESFAATHQNLLQSLSALFVSQGGSLQALNKGVLQSFTSLLGLPLSFEGIFLARTLIPQEVPVSWGGLPRSLPNESPGALKAFFQGIAQLLELPGMKGFAPLLPPVWRAFFGIFFAKGMEIQLKTYHSAMMDELGALLSRSTRRERKRDQKRVSRADRVQRKDQSLPVDSDLHDGEETLPDDVDAWTQSSSRSDESGFTFYLH